MHSTPIMLSASSLIGVKVEDSSGDELGKIEGLMIDLDRGSIAYAVLSLGRFLGLGDKMFAVPWKVLRIDPEAERFVLDIDREALENAPEFDRNEWPRGGRDAAWMREVYVYYGATPYWEAP